jgi:hypothetical protein
MNAKTKQINEFEKERIYKSSIIIKPESHRYTTEDVIELVYLTVPNDYVKTFLHYTVLENEYKTNIFRIYLLGIGKLESGWIKTVSDKQNSNGTRDYGYLMLNEGNIQNRRFMKEYGPDKIVIPQNDIELYLIACINYFRYLYSRYGCDGIYAYNAGETKFLNNTIPYQTYVYKRLVKRYIMEYYDILYDLNKKNRIIKTKKRYEELKNTLKTKIEEWNQIVKFNHRYYHDAGRENMYNNFGYSILISLFYDPRKRMVSELSLRRFIITGLTNSDDIENTVNFGI